MGEKPWWLGLVTTLGRLPQLAAVAQLVEQRFRKAWVVGSSPVSGLAGGGQELCYLLLSKMSILFGDAMVLISWSLSGDRNHETVAFHEARHRRRELEARGAVVYWSERVHHYPHAC